MKFTVSTVLLVVAIVCFLAGWFIAAGNNLFGIDSEWLFAGLLAFAASFLPWKTA